MSKMTPQEMARNIGNGLLSFPVTPFAAGNVALSWLAAGAGRKS